MKKLIPIMLALALLSGCSARVMPSSSSSSAAVSSSPTEPVVEKTPPQLLETITDPAVLTPMWEDYIYDTFISLSNGFVAFDTVEDISKENLANYLYIKMQRNDDTSSVVAATYKVAIPKTKLGEYSQRYFNKVIDFTDGMNSRSFDYNPTTDLCHFYPQNIENLTLISYNSIEEFPNFALESLERYSDDSYVAVCKMRSALAVDEANELITKRFTLQKRPDGSYYMMSCGLTYPKTNYVSVSGDFTELPFLEDLGTLLHINSAGDAIYNLVVKEQRVDFVNYSYKTGEVKKTVSLPFVGAYYSGTDLLCGDSLVVVNDQSFTIFNLDLSVKVATTPFKGISKESCFHDISPDLKTMSFNDEEGIFLYTVSDGKQFRVPDTKPHNDPTNVMRSTAYNSSSLVLNNTLLFCRQVGYEAYIGYLLYDIATGTSKQYPYGAGYGGGTLLDDNGILLTNHQGPNGEMPPTYIDFATGEAKPVANIPPLDAMIPTGAPYAAIVAPNGSPSPIPAEKIQVIDNLTHTVIDTGVTITSPIGSLRILGVTEKGEVYLSVHYMGEQFMLLTKPVSPSATPK